jgi:hypothetical protein
VHAGGAATGAEIERALVDAVQRTATVLHEGWFALDLLVDVHAPLLAHAGAVSRASDDAPAGNTVSRANEPARSERRLSGPRSDEASRFCSPLASRFCSPLASRFFSPLER